MSRGRATEHGLLEWMPDAVVVSDAAGRIVYMNPRAEQLTGCTVEELIGRGIEVLVPMRLRRVHSRHRDIYNASHAGPRPMGGAALAVTLALATIPLFQHLLGFTQLGFTAQVGIEAYALAYLVVASALVRGFGRFHPQGHQHTRRRPAPAKEASVPTTT